MNKSGHERAKFEKRVKRNVTHFVGIVVATVRILIQMTNGFSARNEMCGSTEHVTMRGLCIV
jgi:hypothetical protein